MEAISRFDTFLFYWINGRLTSPVLDFLMPFITEKFNFLGVIIAGVVIILVKGRRRDLRSLAIIVVAVIAGDYLVGVFKHLFGRVRPCHVLAGARVLVGCTSSFSFPSGHASNVFTAMVFLSIRYRRLTPYLLSFAFAVAYSRVYVGVHYPLDIIGGAALGTAVAVAFAEADGRLLEPLIRRYAGKRDSVET